MTISGTHEKKTLRESMIRVRKNISHEEKIRESLVIQHLLFQRSEYRQATVICVYVSLPDEVRTIQIIDHALQQKKTIVVPKVVDASTLQLYTISSREELVSQSFGILEPIQERKDIDTKAVDLFIVPGVSFDRRGHRLGWGKGMYDRLLQHVSVPIIALAFSEQIVPSLPYDAYDRVMSVIISDKIIIEP